MRDAVGDTPVDMPVRVLWVTAKAVHVQYCDIKAWIPKSWIIRPVAYMDWWGWRRQVRIVIPYKLYLDKFEG